MKVKDRCSERGEEEGGRRGRSSRAPPTEEYSDAYEAATELLLLLPSSIPAINIYEY